MVRWGMGMVVVAALLPGAGCAPAEDDASRALTVVDSAGVRVVTLPRESIEEAPTVQLVEALRIGSIDGPDETLFQVLWDAVAHDDEFYLLDAGLDEVRVFDREGAFRRRVGRRGQGPAEFTGASGLRFVADTLAVTSGSRLTFLSNTGSPLATAPSRRMGTSSMLGQVVPLPSVRIGAWRTMRMMSAEPGQTYRETETWTLLDSAGNATDTLVSLDLPEQVRSDDSRVMVLQPFFQDPPRATVGDDGALHVTPGGRYQIDRFDIATSRLDRSIRSAVTAPEVTPALIEAAVAEEAAQLPPDNPSAEAERHALERRATLPTPERLPLLGRLLVSAGGWMLLERLDLDRDPVRPRTTPSVWDLLDPDGGIRGRVELPSEVGAVRLLDDGLLAFERGALDVQSFVWYRFDLSADGG